MAELCVHRGASLILSSIGLSVLALAACDNNATITPNPLLFKEVQVISAYPARQVAGEWERVCGSEDAEGFLLNVAFLSFGRDENPTDPDATDRDRSVRPGDVVKALVVEGGNKEDINFTNTGNIVLDVDCIDPLPDADNLASPTGYNCQGSSGGTSIKSAEYLEYGAKRRDGHNVLVLVDESGSIKGLVNQGDFIEGGPGEINLTGDFQQVASDYNQVRRSTITRMMSILNAEDRVGVIAFGEGVSGDRIKVPCTAAQGSYAADLEECFGTNRDIWDLSSLQTQQGRSNLWEAVGIAWDFLEDEDDDKRTNHIVVVTDGPDTCERSSNLADCQLPCSVASGFPEVLARIDAMEADVNALPIHIHFVQFESKGYRGRDARQWEVACKTGGHYQFINNVDMSTLSPASFEESLNAAVDNVRFSLMGWWQFATESVGYESNSAPPNGTLTGSLYGIDGILRVTQETNLVSQDLNHEFGIGKGSQASQATTWDRRPTLRKTCSGAIDCSGASAASQTDCHAICSAETMVCVNGAAGADLPTAIECTTDVGGDGLCCDGACIAEGTVCALCLP